MYLFNVHKKKRQFYHLIGFLEKNYYFAEAYVIYRLCR